MRAHQVRRCVEALVDLDVVCFIEMLGESVRNEMQWCVPFRMGRDGLGVFRGRAIPLVPVVDDLAIGVAELRRRDRGTLVRVHLAIFTFMW